MTLRIALIATAMIAFIFSAAFAEETTETAPSPEIDRILDGIEQRYAGPGFEARFSQESTLKAMDITDTAEGRLYVQRPGKMRWEYEQPERQIIITDGEVLWIYRPADNQVMIGQAPTYFGGGKGASFLSDIKLIREEFEIRQDPVSADGAASGDADYRLVLIPKEKTPDLQEVLLVISRDTFVIRRVDTVNAYGDKTEIVITDYAFNRAFEESLFSLAIPEGADVVRMDQ